MFYSRFSLFLLHTIDHSPVRICSHVSPIDMNTAIIHHLHNEQNPNPLKILKFFESHSRNIVVNNKKNLKIFIFIFSYGYRREENKKCVQSPFSYHRTCVHPFTMKNF